MQGRRGVGRMGHPRLHAVRTDHGKAQRAAGTIAQGRPGQEVAGQRRRTRAGPPGQGRIDLGRGPARAERARAEKVERDRALAAERNAQARQAEQKAQARQIITAHAVTHKGDDEYRFSDGAAIRTLLIDLLRKALSVGVLVIVAHGEGYALLPALPPKRCVNAHEAIIVDHGQPGSTAEISTGNAEDDAYYAQFQVPDDLVW